MTTPIDITTLDPALASDIAGDEGFQCNRREHDVVAVEDVVCVELVNWQDVNAL